jgi:hypothetical protein
MSATVADEERSGAGGAIRETSRVDDNFADQPSRHSATIIISLVTSVRLVLGIRSARRGTLGPRNAALSMQSGTLRGAGRRCRSRVKVALVRGGLARPVCPIVRPRRGTALVPDRGAGSGAESLRAVRGQLDVIALELQGALESAAKLRLVVYDQYTHGSMLARSPKSFMRDGARPPTTRGRLERW